MEIKKIFETSRFVVRDPKEFTKEYEDHGVRIACEKSKEGFLLSGEETTFDSFMVDNGKHTKEESIAFFIQKHVKEDQEVQIRWVYYESDTLRIKTSFYLVTSCAIHNVTDNQVFEQMAKIILPRQVTCILPEQDNYTKRWLEPTKQYLAIMSTTRNHEEVYIIKHEDGMEIAWSKGCFNG